MTDYVESSLDADALALSLPKTIKGFFANNADQVRQLVTICLSCNLHCLPLRHYIVRENAASWTNVESWTC